MDFIKKMFRLPEKEDDSETFTPFRPSQNAEFDVRRKTLLYQLRAMYTLVARAEDGEGNDAEKTDATANRFYGLISTQIASISFLASFVASPISRAAARQEAMMSDPEFLMEIRKSTSELERVITEQTLEARAKEYAAAAKEDPPAPAETPARDPVYDEVEDLLRQIALPGLAASKTPSPTPSRPSNTFESLGEFESVRDNLKEVANVSRSYEEKKDVTIYALPKENRLTGHTSSSRADVTVFQIGDLLRNANVVASDFSSSLDEELD